MSIGGSGKISGWVLKAGSNFGVTKDGTLYATGANISGTITATGGKIGGWNVDGNKMWNDAGNVTFLPNLLSVSGTTPSGNPFSTPTTWINIAIAGARVGAGKSVSFSLDGMTYTFTDGVLTEIEEE